MAKRVQRREILNEGIDLSVDVRMHVCVCEREEETGENSRDNV